MKTLLGLSLILLPSLVLATIENRTLEKVDFQHENSLVTTHSNIDEITHDLSSFERTVDYPTQIVRIHGSIKDSQKKCEEVGKDISSFFTSKLNPDLFYYNIYTHCQYDPKTNFATAFSIDAYFDPMKDEAIEYLKNYLSEHEGKDLLGTVFHVESATGLVVSLNIDAGISQDEYNTVVLRYRHDNKTLYFPNNYEMMKNFIVDLRKNFYTNEKDYVLPFLKRWFYSYTDKEYNSVLRQSNYVSLQPERIFTMNEAPKAYTSPLRMYFVHKCENYPNKKCL